MFTKLASKADVVIESQFPGQMGKWGLGYERLAERTLDKLIYLSVTDFGQTGPWKDYRANDASHLALGGQMASTGYTGPEEPPIGGQGHQAWHIAGILALQSLTAALMERKNSGRGQHIDCSIHDCCAVCN